MIHVPQAKRPDDIADLVIGETRAFLAMHGEASAGQHVDLPNAASLFIPSSSELSLSELKRITQLGRLFFTKPREIDIPNPDSPRLQLDFNAGRYQLGAFALIASNNREKPATPYESPHLSRVGSVITMRRVIEAGIGYMFYDDEGERIGDYRVCLRLGQKEGSSNLIASSHRYHGYGDNPDIRSAGQVTVKWPGINDFLRVFRKVAASTGDQTSASDILV